MFLSQVNMKNSPNDWFTSVLFTKHYVKLSTKKIQRNKNAPIYERNTTKFVKKKKKKEEEEEEIKLSHTS